MLGCRGFCFTAALFVSSLVSVPSMAAGVNFSQKTSAGSASTLHADFNSDGREDFVYTTSNGAGFAVQLSTGDGTYAAPVDYTLPDGYATTAIAIGDFDPDGKADLVVFGSLGASPYTAYVYLNQGNGTFALKSTFMTEPLSSNLADAIAGDFNHDGKMDVAYVQYPYLTVLFGDGQGGLIQGPRTQVQNTGNLMLGDFDSDGIGDVAIGDYVNNASVQILYGDGTGNFPDTRFINLPAGHSLPGAADVNSDGKMDIVAATFYPNNPNHVSVYYGLADRSWTANTIIPIAHCAGKNAPVAADINGDGINDLVLTESDCADAGQATHYIGVLTRNSNATYNPDQIVYTSASSNLIIENFDVVRGNADSKPDLAFSQCTTSPCTSLSEFEIKVLLNTTGGAFHSCDAPDAYIGMNVCSPVMGGASSSTHVPFRVGAAGQTVMRKVEVWVDGVKEVEQLNGFSKYSYLDHTLDLNPGTHQVDIYAAGWDNWLQEKSFKLNVQ
jgi:hypothetical protein